MGTPSGPVSNCAHVRVCIPFAPLRIALSIPETNPLLTPTGVSPRTWYQGSVGTWRQVHHGQSICRTCFLEKCPHNFTPVSRVGGCIGHYCVRMSLELRYSLEKTAYFHLLCLSFNVFKKKRPGICGHAVCMAHSVSAKLCSYLQSVFFSSSSSNRM